VCIDDLHWADADSMALLHELLRPPDAPPLLLLASVRDNAGDRSIRPALEALPGDVRHLEVKGLDQDAARELVRCLMMRRSETVDPHVAADVAEEAAGHPLFIAELVRHAALPDRPVRTRPDLGDVLWERITRLDAIPRRVLELVALAGGPIANEILARAVGMSISDLHREVAVLRTASLVRAMGTRATDRVEPYHDRVRHAVMSNLPDGAQRAGHHQLARALEASRDADVEGLAVHYGLAGDNQKAADYAIAAAEAASRALAFERSARLFRLALDQLPDPASSAESVRLLLTRMGDELAKAGRGAEAARAYLDASAGAPTAEVLALERRAAQQLLITGHIDEGLATMRSVLAREGLTYPSTPRRALVRVASMRARLWLRGTGFQLRHESELSERELARLDACWHAALGLTMTDHVRGAVFQGYGLLLGLKSGEPFQLARLLAFEAAHLAGVGIRRRKRVEELVESSRQLAQKSKNAHAIAFVLGTRGTTHFLLGEFEAGLAACEAADAQFRERCVGVPWETATMQLWICRALLHLGRIGELTRRVPAAIREFYERHNRYGVTSLRVSVAPFVQLASDRPETALAELREALAQWSGAGFHIQHYYSLYAELAIHLYNGACDAGEALLRERWRALAQSMLLRVQFVRLSMIDARARLTLASGLRSSDASARERCLAAVERDAGRIAAERAPWAMGLARLLSAQVAYARHEPERGIALATAALAAFEAAQMALHAAVTRDLLGVFHDRADAGAHAWMRDQGIQRPPQLAAVFAPLLAGRGA
jgi:hypothetical protein